MSSTRGRVVKQGGVATEPAGFSTRTETQGQQPITRRAYRVANGQFQPAGVGGPAGVLGHPLLDFSTVSGWRLLVVAGALLYVGVFHFSIVSRGISAGVRL